MVSPFTRVTTPLLAFVTASSLQLTPAASATTRTRREAPRTNAALTPTPQTPAAKWERYAFPGDGFSVELPGMPFVFHTIRCIVYGCRDKEKVRVFGHYADGGIFVVVAFGKPRQSETPDDFLTEISGGGVYAPTSRKVAAGRFEGQAYRSATGVARLFMTKKHAYLVKAFARAGSHPSVERYLDSLTLSDAGRVTNIGVVRGLPDGLTERATYAARHPLFFPAQKDGRDVSQHITFEYYFNIYVE